jgi:hypothetical protein
MSLEQVSERRSSSGSGYAQEQIENANSTSSNTRASAENGESRSDKNLRSASSTATTDGTKASIAFNLSFVIKLTNRTPFDPSKTSC